MFFLEIFPKISVKFLAVSRYLEGILGIFFKLSSKAAEIIRCDVFDAFFNFTLIFFLHEVPFYVIYYSKKKHLSFLPRKSQHKMSLYQPYVTDYF